MSNLHPTYSDKDRPVNLVTDAEWNEFYILIDGVLTKKATPPPGLYILQVQLSGSYALTSTPKSQIEVRADRYPFDKTDNGTAWNKIDWSKSVVPGRWFGTIHAKVEVKASGVYSTGIGVGYRIRGGKVTCDSRVLKFIRQMDE